MRQVNGNQPLCFEGETTLSEALECTGRSASVQCYHTSTYFDVDLGRSGVNLKRGGGMPFFLSLPNNESLEIDFENVDGVKEKQKIKGLDQRPRATTSRFMAKTGGERQT